MATNFEFGLDTFGDITVDTSGKLLKHDEVLRNIVTEVELADQLGLDFFGVGEHHRPDFAVSAPEVVLAAIASRTKRIHLGSVVTVLSSDDPVRRRRLRCEAIRLRAGRGAELPRQGVQPGPRE